MEELPPLLRYADRTTWAKAQVVLGPTDKPPPQLVDPVVLPLGALEEDELPELEGELCVPPFRWSRTSFSSCLIRSA
jgi:hypothetical protein